MGSFSWYTAPFSKETINVGSSLPACCRCASISPHKNDPWQPCPPPEWLPGHALPLPLDRIFGRLIDRTSKRFVRELEVGKQLCQTMFEGIHPADLVQRNLREVLQSVPYI